MLQVYAHSCGAAFPSKWVQLDLRVFQSTGKVKKTIPWKFFLCAYIIKTCFGLRSHGFRKLISFTLSFISLGLNLPEILFSKIKFDL